MAISKGAVQIARPRRGGEVWMEVIDPDLFPIYMRRQRLTTRQLAAMSGCKQAMISHLCTGRRRSCSTRLATAIAVALKVDLNALFVPKSSISAKAAA